MVASLSLGTAWSGKNILPNPNLVSAALVGELVYTGGTSELKKWTLSNGVLKETGKIDLQLVVAVIQTCAAKLFCLCYPVNVEDPPLQIIGVDPSTMQQTGNYQNVSAFTTTDTELVVGSTDKNVYILDPADFSVKFRFTTELTAFCTISVLKSGFAATDYKKNLSVYSQTGTLSTTKKIDMQQPMYYQSLDGDRLVLGDIGNPNGPGTLEIWKTAEVEEQLVLNKLTTVPLTFCPSGVLVEPELVVIAGSNGINLFRNNFDFTSLGVIPNSPLQVSSFMKLNDSSFLALSFGSGLWLYQKGVLDDKKNSGFCELL